MGKNNVHVLSRFYGMLFHMQIKVPLFTVRTYPYRLQEALKITLQKEKEHKEYVEKEKYKDQEEKYKVKVEETRVPVGKSIILGYCC